MRFEKQSWKNCSEPQTGEPNNSAHPFVRATRSILEGNSGKEGSPEYIYIYGYWTPSSLESLKTIAAKTTSRNRTTFSQAFNNLMQQLSVRIWQYNARMINARINLDVDFDFWDLPTMGGVG